MTSVQTDRMTAAPQGNDLATPQNTVPAARAKHAPVQGQQQHAPNHQAPNDFVTTTDRSSPDPLLNTDRYRLNMPFLDRLD